MSTFELCVYFGGLGDVLCMLHLNCVCDRDHSSNSSLSDIISLECCLAVELLMALNYKGSGAIRRTKRAINTFINSTR